jgi:hypothetical protein
MLFWGMEWAQSRRRRDSMGPIKSIWTKELCQSCALGGLMCQEYMGQTGEGEGGEKLPLHCCALASLAASSWFTTGKLSNKWKF